MPAAPVRPNLYVMCRFLDRLADGPTSRSRLQLAVRLNYDLFTHYLEILRERRFVEVQQDGATLSLTPQGHAARARLATLLREWLDGPPARMSPPSPEASSAAE